MHVDEEQLKTFILDSGQVSRKDYEAAEKDAAKAEVSVGQFLVQKGVISEDDLRRMQAYVLGIPFINLKGQKIDFSVLSLIPEPIARKHSIIAFKKKDDDLEVAMLDTDDLRAIEFIKKKVQMNILPRLTDGESIRNALMQYQKTLKDEFGDLIRRESEALKMGVESESAEDLKKMAENLPVVRIVNALLKHAIIQGASDIHIEPQEKEVIIRYRIDGLLHDAMTLPIYAGSGITARIKVLSNLKLDEKRLPQDGRFKMEMDGQKVSFRVSTLPTYYGEKTVMRLLREGKRGYTLEALGFHGKALEGLHEAMQHTTGMILTTGPTGSGKTTTLYTLLDILNTTDVNISTIEDPIEYQMERINQTQVKSEIGLTFANGLRTLMRQDPDIIMVGEIRDKETASLAINASLTGHLVLSTLHTNSAAGAIPRLIDMGIEPFLLVSTLDVVIGQRLVRVLTDTREPYKLSKQEVSSLEKMIDLKNVMHELKEEKIVSGDVDWTDVDFYKPKPTDESPEGFKGRKGVYEVLVVSPTIKELIVKGATADQIEKQAREEGMLKMVEDGVFKAASGMTTMDEVLRVIHE